MSKIDKAPQNNPHISLQQKKLMDLQRKQNNPMAQLNKAAQMYEKHFLTEMVKAMRSTVSNGGLIKESMGSRIYNQELDQEYVKSWVARGGVGLSKLIEQQMMQQFGIRPPQPAPNGPQPGMFKIQQQNQTNPNKLNMKIEASKPQSSLELPWAGKVSSWQQNQNSPSGHLLMNHGEFESVWALPQKPSFNIGEDIAAGSLLLNMEPSIAVNLEIRNKVFS